MMSRYKLPPYLVLREGRPRWIPGPKLRSLGFKGQDLKDAAGAWLSEGAAIERAKALNALVGNSPAQPDPVYTRTMKALFDRYLKSPQFTRLGARTRGGYEQHIAILEAWAGDKQVSQLPRASITEFHAALEAGRGAATANAIMRTLKLVLNYAKDELEWIDRNRAASLEMAKTEGRRVMWTPEEIVHFVTTADGMGLASQGDALLLGALTAQRQGDVLALLEGDYKDGLYTLKTMKTAAIAHVPAVPTLIARIEAARRRKLARWGALADRHEVVYEKTGRGYRDNNEFGKEFRAVRTAAAKGMGSIASKLWQDLRDTGVTYLFLAGCTDAEIATITAHSLQTVKAILDRHYFVRDEAFARAAGQKLSLFLTSTGLQFTPKALPAPEKE